MESINFIKGYGKVNPSENHPNPPPNHHHRRRRTIIIALSLAVFLTLIIASLVAVLICDSATESEQSESSQLASNSADSLKTVCAVTRYPDSCFFSISPLNSPPSNNPLRFFNMSLHASMLEISNLKNRLAEPKTESAMKDCAELFDDAASQLGRSAESICVGRGEKVLTEMRISDLQTWISAAMTDQETCLDGLTEMGSTALGEFRVKVQRSQEYLSNTLAILNNIPSLFKKFGLTMP
ncbi:pectinesterase 3 [Phtheirospermum japonicum]|uniref:pectinesterase n=1 Tax=Phtheirospermum japonicum TaxID=374723 RepID=A0A830CPD7_9LAMI|nr:pectinesterase 3 [Phtheirospermum japonicum]